MRRLLVVALAALMIMTMGAGAAFAGEITGNGRPLWIGEGADDPEAHHTLHGQSACAFSGLNDWSYFNEGPDPDGFGRTQSWGQIPKDFRDFLSTIGAHPGQACNPNIGEPEL